MAMSDCAKCWETPCVCGHDYRGWTVDQLKRQIQMLKSVLADKLLERDDSWDNPGCR